MSESKLGPMRILQVLSSRSTAYGGPVRTAEGIARVTRAQGHEVRFFVAEEDGAVRSFLGRPAYWPGRNGRRVLERRVRWADIVHVHGLWTPANTLACRLAYRWERRLVVSPQGTLHTWALAQKRLKKAVYAALFERTNLRIASALHCVTRREVEQVRRYGVTTPAFVVPNGVPGEDLDRWSEEVLPSRINSGSNDEIHWPARAALEAAIPHVAGQVIVLFLGRLAPQKGLEYLVPGFASARAEVPNLHLLLAGPDEDGYQGEIDVLARKCGVRDGVTFAGLVQARLKRSFLLGADLFALTSNSEGDPLALKEALAAGLPSVVTPICLPSDSDRIGGGGQEEFPAMIVGWDADEVGSALAALARNPERRRALGRRARTYARQYHSEERMGLQMLGIYRDLLLGQRTAETWA